MGGAQSVFICCDNPQKDAAMNAVDDWMRQEDYYKIMAAQMHKSYDEETPKGSSFKGYGMSQTGDSKSQSKGKPKTITV